MIKRIRVERWVTSDGSQFDHKDVAEKHELRCVMTSCLDVALGQYQVVNADWHEVVQALLHSPHLVIMRKAKP